MSTATLAAVKPIVLAAGVAILVALLGATVTDLGDWYQQLDKPPWQPPDWLFGPAWTVIYLLITIAALQGWQAAPPVERSWLIGLFCLNGFLNVLWSLLFFRVQRPDWASIEVILLWLSIVWLMVVLARYRPLAAWLLVPYLLWVGFAGYLNWTVVQLNGPFPGP